MKETITAEVQQLVHEGRAAAMAGDTFAARASFRRATEIDPACAEAWLGLSGVVPILAEKHEYLKRALELDPGNDEAEASLRYVEKLQAEGLQIAPSKRREERNASGDASPILSAPEPAQPAAAIEYCYRHPDRETGLHCIQCNRPICGACAQTTPVGQLCPECRRGRRPSNYQVSPGNVIVGAVVALIASAITALLLLFVARGFFSLIILFIAGPAIAEFIVRIVDQATRLKRGRAMQIAVGAAIALGSAPVALFFGNPLLLLFTALAVTTAVARLR